MNNLSKLTDGQLYIFIKENADNHGQLITTHTQMAKKLDVNRMTVIRHLRKLQSLDFVRSTSKFIENEKKTVLQVVNYEK